MKLLEVFNLDYDTVPKTIGYKIMTNIATLEDQEEALKKPQYAYEFALNIPGADIKKCEEAVCKNPKWAYMFARYVPGADIRKCEEAAYKDPGCARLFARDIPFQRLWRPERAASPAL